MRLLSWFRADAPKVVVQSPGLEAMAAGLAVLLRQLCDFQDLQKIGSAAKAVALQRLVPQAASLTIGTFRRDNNDKREKGDLATFLNYEISDVCTGYNFWEAVFGQLFADNNAFSFRQTVDNGLTLRAIPRGAVTVIRPDPVNNPWQLIYKWRGQDYGSDRIWHIRLHAADSTLGVPWESELAIFELAASAEKLAYNFFNNGGNVERIWKYAGLNADGKGLATAEQIGQQQNLLDAILRHQVGKTGNVVVPSYFEHQEAKNSLREGQMIETRKFQSEEILSLFGTDKPGDLEALYTVALVPVLECVEQAITRDLLTPAQRAAYKIQYIAEGRFRGSITKWITALKEAVAGTIMTPNEARQRSGLGLDDVDGGDALINPNTMPTAVSGRRDAAAAGDTSNDSSANGNNAGNNA